MRRRTTRIGCLGILLVFSLYFAWLSWNEGPLNKGAAPFVFGIFMLVVIYVNDAFEWLKEKRQQQRRLPPKRGA